MLIFQFSIFSLFKYVNVIQLMYGLLSLPSFHVLSISTVFTVQDRPGPGREEDREAPRKTDETHGVQGDTQWSHGDRLKCCRTTGRLEYLD